MKQIVRSPFAASIVVFAFFCFLQIATVPTRDSYLSNYDHGYQLGVGIQLLRGRLPGVDILTHYGPMVFYASAAWFKLTGSLLGETIACAVGYASCLTIIYSLLARHVSRLAGLSGAATAFLLEARFYKWYIWLFPLGTIWLLDRISRSRASGRPWCIAATGVWVGVGWLFRWDIGTTGAAACLVFLFLVENGLRLRLRVPWRAWLAFTLPFLVPPLAWFSFLWFARGIDGVRSYVWISLKGAVNLSRVMAQSLPSFNAAEPLGQPSVIVLAYAFLIATYLVCCVIGLKAQWRGESSTRSRLLLAIVLVGLSTFHQGMYRKGPYHLLQVIPPVIVASFVLIAMFYAQIATPAFEGGARARLLRLLGSAFLVCTVISGLGLVPAGRVDLSAFNPWPHKRLQELAHPLRGNHGARPPLLAVLHALHSSTAPNDSILVFPTDTQYFAFLDRPVSGRLTVFVPGFFDAGIERTRNMDAIRRSMPKAVIVAAGLGWGNPAPLSPFHNDSAKAHAYVLDFIRENYTRKLFECDRCVVLGREERSPEPSGSQVAGGSSSGDASRRR